MMASNDPVRDPSGQALVNEAPAGLHPSGFDPSRVGSYEMSGEFVICPGCGCQQGDCREWVTDKIGNDNCPNCGSFLAFWAEHSVTYYTKLVLLPRDRDGSAEGGQTAQQAGPEGQQPGPKASPHD